MPVTAKSLKRAHQAYLTAEALAAVRVRRRNELIRTAVAQGVPQVRIAKELRLAKQRVAQIARATPP